MGEDKNVNEVVDPRSELREITRFPPHMDDDLKELNITLKLAVIEVYCRTHSNSNCVHL